METLVKERQAEYHRVLRQAGQQADSAVFVEFLLTAILDALREIQQNDQVNDQDSDQVNALLRSLGGETLSAAVLMQRLGLSHRPTFRKNYINPALEAGLIERTIPEKPNSQHQKYRRRRA